MKKIGEILKSEKGQGLVEYAILVSLIALVSIVVVTTLGTHVKTAFTNITAKF